MGDPRRVRVNGIGMEPTGFAAARAELLRLTRRRQYIALATASPDGHPGVAPLRYAVTDDFELAMGTLRTSRKYQNLRCNPSVAALVFDHEFAIQVQGTFDEPADAEQERLRGIFAREFPTEARQRERRPTHVYFRITPTWVRYSDFSDDPGRVLTLDFLAESETRQPFPVIEEE